MLPKISRYLLIVITVITLAYVLPGIYNTLFDTRINAPYISYSTTQKDYYVSNWSGVKGTFTDRSGKTWSQQEFMDKTPIENFRYHLSKGSMPDSVAGVKLYPQQLQREDIFAWIEPNQLDIPQYGLYPLFESQPEFGLSFSKDYFRITNRIEFIDAKSNKLNEAKSKIFTEALTKEGFSYPAKLAGGLPTLMKRRDEGWFVVDAKEQLFHLKMIKGAPFVKKIAVPAGMQIKYIICNDYDADEFYAAIITRDHQFYLLNKKDYSTTQVPLEGYNSDSMSIMINGNIFNKTFAVKSDRGVLLQTFDRNYQLIDKYFYELPQKSELAHGKVAAAIFPFQLLLTSPFSEFINPQVEESKSWSWLGLNLLLVIATVIIIRREGKSLNRSVADIVIVALTGIFGFLAILIIPNKQY